MFNRYIITLQRDRARFLLAGIYTCSSLYKDILKMETPDFTQLLLSAVCTQMHYKFLKLHNTLDYTHKPMLRFSFTLAEVHATLLVCEVLLNNESVNSSPFNTSTIREVMDKLAKALKNKPEFFS